MVFHNHMLNVYILQYWSQTDNYNYLKALNKYLDCSRRNLRFTSIVLLFAKKKI